MYHINSILVHITDLKQSTKR